MLCIECGETETQYNSIIGETECASCGLILITELFEETVSAYDSEGNQLSSADWLKLGSRPTHKFLDRENSNVQTGINMAKLLLGTLVTTKSLRADIEVNYLKAYRKQLFGKYSLEDRATALVYYVLRENSLPYTMKEVANQYNANVKVAFVIVKRLSKVFGKKLNSDTRAFAEKYALQINAGIDYVGACGLVADFFEGVCKVFDLNLRPSSSIAICWIVATAQYKQIKQLELCVVGGVDRKTIYDETKRLLNMVGKTIEEIEGKGISELI